MTILKKFILLLLVAPFLENIKKFKNIKVKDAINHPNWQMGKKISVDYQL